ncbi:hypothetical protein J4462_03490 [Candidatus Pacearchaeota archaeon]|nr:hypothetical protein [Candidatus Pacearchaeota archaeon]
MRCEEFDARRYAVSLVIEGCGFNYVMFNSNMGAVEEYCHHESCSSDERRFQEYIAGSREFTLQDLGAMFDGIDRLEDLVNPDPSILDAA